MNENRSEPNIVLKISLILTKLAPSCNLMPW